MARLEDRCATCPELLADSYGKCDHGRCIKCVKTDRAIKTWCAGHAWLEDWAEVLGDGQADA
jgi:hypothetical protein